MSGRATGITNCMIAGVGGQGTILAARIVGTAAMSRGMHVRGSETIGMAQRGGSVASHVRMGFGAVEGNGACNSRMGSGAADGSGARDFSGAGHKVHSPLISPGEADVIVAFEPFEGARVARFLAPGGLMVVCDRVLPPPGQSAAAPADLSSAPVISWLRAAAHRIHVVDGEALVAACGALFLNVALLASAAALGAFPFGVADLEQAVARRVPPHRLEDNTRALRYGLRLAE